MASGIWAENCTKENDLILEAKSGSLDAFNHLVMMYQTDVYNVANWMVKDSQAAEDITQDTFLKAYQRMREFRGGSFRGWLLRVAKNACLDELRRQKRQHDVALNPVNRDGEENENPEWLSDGGSVQLSIESKELRRALQSWIQELQTKYSMAMVLVDVMTLDYAEAAMIMDVPIGTVKSRVARARMYVRSRYKDFHFEPRAVKRTSYGVELKNREDEVYVN